MNTFYKFLLKKNIFVYLVTVLISILGIAALITSQREAFPQVEFGVATISTAYPGASPEETEKFVTDVIETAIKNVDGIDELQSISAEGRSYIIITFQDGIDVDNCVTDLQTAVNRISDFPEDVEDPLITKTESGSFPILTVSLSGGPSYQYLRETTKLLEDQLNQIDSISQISRSGYLKREYRVEVDPSLMRQFFVTLKDISKALAERNINMPGGTLETPKEEILVRSIGEFKEANEVKHVIVRSNEVGKAIRIQDVGTVEDTFEEQKVIEKLNGKEAIDLTIVKRESADIIRTIQSIQSTIDTFSKRYDMKGITVSYSNDASVIINRRLSTLIGNASVGIVIVFLSLFVFLNFNIAIRVAVGIPFSVLGALIVMKAFGISINMISLLGFILVIGMVVDNPIVVGENIMNHYEEGKDPETAVVEGTSEVVIPIVFSSLTTFAAFSPLLMMGGTIGKFVWSIPIVVMLAIATSLVFALLILPNLTRNILKKRQLKLAKKEKAEKSFEGKQRFLNQYGNILHTLIRHKYKVCLFAIAALFGSFVLAGNGMKFVLFPNEDAEQFTITVEGPTRTSLRIIETQLQEIEQEVAKLPKTEMEHYKTSVGLIQAQSRSGDTRRGSNIGQIVVKLTPEKERTRKSRTIIETLRNDIKTHNMPDLKVRFDIARGGPPVGKPVQIDILGDDYEKMKEAEKIAQKTLEGITGIKDIQTSLKPGKAEIQIKIDETVAAQAQLNVLQIANEVRSAIAGNVPTYIRKGEDEIDVRVMYNKANRQSETDLTAIQIPNQKNQLINLDAVVKLELGEGYSDFQHLNRKRKITVSADIDTNQTTSFEVNKTLGPVLLELQQKFPSLDFLQRGENEDTQESIRNLMVAFIFALLLIYMLIAALFNSFVEPIVIMLAIPFGIIGVIIAFFLHHQPISFMMMMGVIGLSGVVVNNTIILVSVITELRQQGYSNTDSIVEGGKRRLRAVLLTSITTLLGLFPTAYGLGGSDYFIIPLCLALAWGMLFSTVLTLLLLPCTYAVFDEWRDKINQRKLKAQEN